MDLNESFDQNEYFLLYQQAQRSPGREAQKEPLKSQNFAYWWGTLF